jgi:predicted ATP-dependent serine protease
MADTPWRCSECGTVNAPSANSCRTCGRWPSLFDLQDNAVGEVESDEFEGDEMEDPAFEVEEFEPEPAEGAPVEHERRTRGRRRQLVRLIIPLGVVIYLLISSYFSNH